MFQNPEIALDDIPNVENVDWQKLDSAYARRMLVERLLIAFMALAVSFMPYLAAGEAFAPTVPLWGIVIVVMAPFVGWPFVSVPRRGYVVRDRDIIFKSGVIWRSVTAIPYNRIQHVETSSTPLDRRFSLANLQIFTAGGSGGDLKILGLAADTAERLRTFILEKVGASIEND